MTETAKENSYYATGRRKRAVARVWLREGEGKTFSVNGVSLEKYFTRETSKMIVHQPLELTNLEGKFDIQAKVNGGGPNGQAGALRLGIARALLQYKDELRSALRNGGLLTRDPREKERKKFGRKGARRSFQYTKR
jgi:small subunit ribosomal protein S9